MFLFCVLDEASKKYIHLGKKLQYYFENLLPKKNFDRNKIQKRQNLVCDVLIDLIHETPHHNMQRELKIANTTRLVAPDLQLPSKQLKSLEHNIHLLQINNCKDSCAPPVDIPKVTTLVKLCSFSLSTKKK